MKKLVIIFGLLISNIAYAVFPPCDSAGKPWREGNKPYYCSGVGGAWLEVDTDDHENVVRYGAICDSATDSSAAFIAANAAATASGKRVYIPSCPSGQDYLIDENVTFTNPVEFASDALINIQAGDAVAFNGISFIAPDEQIIAGEVENVTFGEPQVVNARWFGYSTSNGDINRRAIQSAINSLTSGTVKIKGEWLVKHDTALDRTTYPIIQLKDNVSVSGETRETSILKVVDANGQYTSILGNRISSNPIINVDNITIEDITFDHNYTNNTANSATEVEYLSHLRGSVYIYGGSNITFQRNRVTDADSIVCVYLTGDATGLAGKEFSNGVVKDSRFDNIGNLIEHYDHSTINVGGTGIKVINNEILAENTYKSAGTAIELHASDCLVTNNVTKNMYTGVIITGIDPYGDNEQITVANNEISTRIFGISLWSQQKNNHTTGYGLNRVTIENNNIYIDYDNGYLPTDELRGPSGITDSVSSDTLPMRNVHINNNNIDFNIETADIDAWIQLSVTGGIVFSGGDNTVLRENFKITNNTISDAPLAGIVFNSTAIKNLSINDNMLVNWASAQFTTASAIYKVGVKLNNIYNLGQIDINNNVLIDDRATSLIAYEYYLSESDTTTAGLIDFKDNTLQVLDAVHTSFVSNFYNSADNTILPYIKEQGNLIALPLFSFRAGSELYNLSTNKKYFLGANGTAWDEITYTLNKINYSGNLEIEQTSLLNNSTGDENAYILNYTTNKGVSGNDTGLFINKTDTASPGTSYLIRAESNSSSKFSVTDEGVVSAFNNINSTTGVVTPVINANANDTTIRLQSRDFTVADNGIETLSGTDVTNSSGQFNGITIVPVYNQSGTAAATDLLINRTETAVGSGIQRLIDAQVATVSKFTVTNTGQVTATAGIKAASVVADPCGTYPAGSMFYNSTSGYPCYCSNAGADLKFSDDTDCF